MRFAITRVENWYVPVGSCAIENSPCVVTVALYTTRVARFTACTGSPRAGTPSGSRIFPVSEPVPGCWADNAAAETTAIRRNDRMDALYNPSAAHPGGAAGTATRHRERAELSRDSSRD